MERKDWIVIVDDKRDAPDYGDAIGYAQDELSRGDVTRVVDAGNVADAQLVYDAAEPVEYGMAFGVATLVSSVVSFLLFAQWTDFFVAWFNGAKLLGAVIVMLGAVVCACGSLVPLLIYVMVERHGFAAQQETISRAITEWVNGGYRGSDWYRGLGGADRARYDALYAQVSTRVGDNGTREHADLMRGNATVRSVEDYATSAFTV